MKPFLLMVTLPFLLGQSYPYPAQVGPGPGGPSGGASAAHSEIVFDAPLNHTGFSDLTVMPQNVPTPTYVWSAASPTADLVSGEVLTKNGDPVAIETPFCPDGDFSDLTSCLPAIQFDGTGDFYDATNVSYMGPADDTDFSVCMVARYEETGTSSYMVSKNKNGETPQWNLRFTDTGANCNFLVKNATPTTGTATAGTTNGTYAWNICCGTYDADGNMTAYSMGASAADAAPGADVNADDAVQIGADGDGTNPSIASIAGVWYWDSLLTAAQVDEFQENWFGINEKNGAEATLTSTFQGNCWQEGKLETFARATPRIGCQYEPNQTGGGNPTEGHYMAQDDITQSVLNTRVLSSNWTETGSSVIACSQTDTPFRDQRTTCSITDDDAAASEGIIQTVAWSGADAGDELLVCLYAAGSPAVDIQVTEKTGASCSGATYNFTDQAITSTWGVYSFLHTVVDGDCTDFQFNIYPLAGAGVASNTGAAYLMANVFLGVDENMTGCPQYIENAGSTQAAGNDVLKYSLSSHPALESGTTLVGDNSISLSLHNSTVTYFNLVRIFALGNGTDKRLEMNATSTFGNLHGFDMYSTAGGGNIFATTGDTFGSDSQVLIEYRVNFDTDVYQLFINGTLEGSATTSLTSPDLSGGVTVGNAATGSRGCQNGCFYRHLRIEHDN